MDIFQLKKSLRLLNNKLLIPKDDNERTKKSTESKPTHALPLTTNALTNLIALNPDPSKILTIDAAKFNFDSTISNFMTNYNADSKEENNLGEAYISDSAKSRLCRETPQVSMPSTIKSNSKTANVKDTESHHEPQRQKRSWAQSSKNDTDYIHSITDFGYFPDTMNFLERCPEDKNHLCLNLLGDEVPGWYHFFLSLLVY